MNAGVYQSKEYLSALNEAGEKIVDVSQGFFCIEKTISLPFLGKKKILEGRGNSSNEDLAKLKKISTEYYYSTVAPCIIGYSDKNFNNAGFKKVENYTILVDLSKNEEELWKAMDKGSIRWGVNSAKKNGLKFGIVENDLILEEFYKMYEETAVSGNFRPEKLEFVKRLTKTDIAKLFFVKKDGKVVAGGMILIDKYNKYSILDLTSVSEEGMKLQAMPFLYWNLILYSKSIGLNYFDLGGYDKEAKEGEKTWNINKFKERFGGEVKMQPIYASNWKYGFFRAILRRFRFMKGGYKKE
jgi:lipid II:glycine glycyltransferase (peptidoglycan interpeptide bridge formation enzyme)